MLSHARVYIFNVTYYDFAWVDILKADQLAGVIGQTLHLGIPDLTFKNLQFVNVHDFEKHTCQIHINKITYKKQTILPKEYVAELRMMIKGQLNKIYKLKFDQIHVVNDEFTFKSTPGFLTGEL